MKTIIRAENLGKQYQIGASRAPYLTFRESLVETVRAPFRKFREETDTLWALRDVNFEINQGDTVGIIGRNGAGKSTLLKVLSRITEPTTGRVELYGRIASLLEVGTGFHPELTGRENIFLNGAILGMKRGEIEKKFDEIVAFAEIEKFLETPVKRYSSGMYVRLAFAVAAHLEPEVLVVDEVLAVGDASFQKKCLGKMQDVSQTEGRTVLFVSHNITAVESLCTKGLLLRNGELVKSGNIKDVTNAYLSKEAVSESVKEWRDPAEAPGSDLVRLKRVAVVPRFENEETEIRVDTPVDIEFEFWSMLPELAEVNLSVVLWSFAGECIFNVGSNILDTAAGVCRGRLSIPANFLNDNKYTLEVYIIKDSSVVLHKESNVVSFEVLDVPRTGNWYGKWIGAVRPKFDFELSGAEF
jgi:lipopolysaccharide transport system ATP-binding protein